tara:strand:- start:539 stop:1096 length:558 start_codon:yes stop_codon:yes gene_type:complete
MKRLNNPHTINYLNFKKWATGSDCLWSYIPSATPNYEDPTEIEGEQRNLPFYTRTILKRPENDFRYPALEHSDTKELRSVIEVLNEIMDFNNIQMTSYMRISLNCVHPEKEVYNTLPHIDHQFLHGNIIVYLTDSGGKTFVKNEDKSKYFEHDPVEDDIILFSGKHFMQNPSDNRRVILVATFIP